MAKTIKQLQADVESSLELARALALTGTHAENQEASTVVEKAKRALSDGITAGAKPCPTCKAKIHGLVQMVPVRKKPTPIFEVGCTTCRDHRAQGFSPALAVEAWNAGPEEWLPPSTGPGVKLDAEPAPE